MAQTQTPLPATADLFCPQCGYNLRGSTNGLCPECGAKHELAELSASRIAWTSRRQVGRVRAWERTVLAATFRTQLLAESLQADLTRRDARWFWLSCVVPLWAGIAVLLLASRLGDYSLMLCARLGGSALAGSWGVQLIYPWHIAVKAPAVVVGMALMATLSFTLLPVRIAMFCRYPSDLRERAITAAHYLVGAMVGGAILGFAVAVLAWAAIVAMGGRGRFGEALGTTLAVFAPATALVLWILAIARFHRKAIIPAGTSAPPLGLVFVPLACLHLGVWLVLVPWVIGFLWLIVSTLRG